MKKSKLQKVTVQVFEHLQVEITINSERNGYNFKTPKCWGGRFYYSFCNNLQLAFAEQYPELDYELNMNIRNN